MGHRGHLRSFSSPGAAAYAALTEIRSSKEFFDYEAKYTPGVTNEVTPEIPAPAADHIAAWHANCISALIAKSCGPTLSSKKAPVRCSSEAEHDARSGENSIASAGARCGMTLQAFYGMLIEECLEQVKIICNYSMTLTKRSFGFNLLVIISWWYCWAAFSSALSVS